MESWSCHFREASFQLGDCLGLLLVYKIILFSLHILLESRKIQDAELINFMAAGKPLFT